MQRRSASERLVQALPDIRFPLIEIVRLMEFRSSFIRRWGVAQSERDVSRPKRPVRRSITIVGRVVQLILCDGEVTSAPEGCKFLWRTNRHEHQSRVGVDCRLRLLFKKKWGYNALVARASRLKPYHHPRKRLLRSGQR